MALNVLRGMYERKQRKLAADRQGYGWVVDVASTVSGEGGRGAVARASITKNATPMRDVRMSPKAAVCRIGSGEKQKTLPGAER
jgi:hypothetical protein